MTEELEEERTRGTEASLQSRVLEDRLIAVEAERDALREELRKEVAQRGAWSPQQIRELERERKEREQQMQAQSQKERDALQAQHQQEKAALQVKIRTGAEDVAMLQKDVAKA